MLDNFVTTTGRCYCCCCYWWRRSLAYWRRRSGDVGDCAAAV